MKIFFKHFYFIQLIIYLQGCSSDLPGENISDLTKEKLKGEIKSVKLTRFEVVKKFGEIKKASKIKYSINQKKYYHYNGQIKYFYSFSDNDIFYFISQNEYDNDGKIIKSISKNGKGKLIELLKIEYKKLKNIHTTYYANGNEKHQIIEILDQSDNVIKKLKWNFKNNKKEQNPEFVKKFKYDKNNNLIEETDLDIFLLIGNKERAYKTTSHIYDLENRLIKTKSIEYLKTFIETIYSDSSCVISSNEFKYNKNGDLIYEKSNIKFPLNPKFRKYDLSFNPNVNEKKQILSYTYKYDKNNNWIEQIEFKNSTANVLTERKIEYY